MELARRQHSYVHNDVIIPTSGIETPPSPSSSYPPTTRSDSNIKQEEVERAPLIHNTKEEEDIQHQRLCSASNHSEASSVNTPTIRERKSATSHHHQPKKHHNHSGEKKKRRAKTIKKLNHKSKNCCYDAKSVATAAVAESGRCLVFWRGTLIVVNVLAKIVLWGSIAAMAAGFVWYTRELIINGTDPHLIAWFSAGAFVLLGFPISMYGIFMHLSNYYQPNIQCYVVRILWMVPIYSIESWLCLRFHEFAIYIETLRDCYESYVLYCFLHYLIEVLGGEYELTLMLKDKSPTRGVHFAPLHWCCKPWIMGQPVTRISHYAIASSSSSSSSSSSHPAAKPPPPKAILTKYPSLIQWRSPFYIKCKFGVLQYVLLKNICAVLTMILELHGLYKEGDFSPKSGYLYICIVTNTSQCWALYCLAFFYYATKNELGPIRPVGKFLAVKALVFFTWWQSLFISILYQWGLIPDYNDETQWSAEDIAKGLQDYLICIEMFMAAIMHVFVFPYTDYIAGSMTSSSPSATTLSNRAMTMNHGGIAQNRTRMLGRRRKRMLVHDRVMKKPLLEKDDDHVPAVEEEDESNHEMTPFVVPSSENSSFHQDQEDDYLDTTVAAIHAEEKIQTFHKSIELLPDDENIVVDNSNDDDDIHSLHSNNESEEEESDQESFDDDEDEHPPLPPSPIFQRQTFVRAFLDSTMPRDVVDNTVGIVKGDYKVEKKTLLHHAATSDEYDLFSKRRRQKFKKSSEKEKKTLVGQESDGSFIAIV